MRYATVADLISALQKMPQDAPVFGYSETDECDNHLEVVELYTPTKEDEEDFAAAVAENPEWPWITPLTVVRETLMLLTTGEKIRKCLP